MKQKEIVVIRVITLKDDASKDVHGKLIEGYYPMLHTTSYCIPNQPYGICSHETKAEAIPKIIALAEAHRCADGIIVSCCDDPAVSELKSKLQIPIIGAGSSVCALALNYGKTAGIIGITDDTPKPYEELLGDRLINLGRPENVHCTLDLMTEAGRKAVIRKAQELKAYGVGSIVLACTGMSTIKIAGEMERLCQIPVIDPVMAEGLLAYYACLRTENNSKGEAYVN